MTGKDELEGKGWTIGINENLQETRKIFRIIRTNRRTTTISMTTTTMARNKQNKKNKTR